MIWSISVDLWGSRMYNMMNQFQKIFVVQPVCTPTSPDQSECVQPPATEKPPCDPSKDPQCAEVPSEPTEPGLVTKAPEESKQPSPKEPTEPGLETEAPSPKQESPATLESRFKEETSAPPDTDKEPVTQPGPGHYAVMPIRRAVSRIVWLHPDTSDHSNVANCSKLSIKAD
ncbi:predicted GPI-anchored protein 58 [Sitophilus oryzae]|uniref:Predicted GPI-anchored protein 58 n=1 Tax=Sitophilus oryzae TaxID=7048 RepID=A0A6J2YHB3_SITOR|nr:predicted GPI-anchored protein 58 [Sitophilus oryzae]